jgi:hypothetical protein
VPEITIPSIKDGKMTNPYQNQDPQYGANPYQNQDPQQSANPYQGQDPQQGYGGYGNYGQHPPQPTYQQQQPMYQQPRSAEKGFFARLFDLSFDQFVTTSVVKVIFIVVVSLQGLYALSLVIIAFAASSTGGIITLLLAPVGWFFAVLLTRVWLELMVVIFKIKEDLGAIRTRGGL